VCLCAFFGKSLCLFQFGFAPQGNCFFFAGRTLKVRNLISAKGKKSLTHKPKAKDTG